MANAKKKKTRRKAMMLGVGLDSDGHKRVTTGPNFTLVGGSEETHEVMTEKVIKINEKLATKGKQLEEDSNAIYECGLESKGDAWVQFKSEYYLYAIIFLIFDVETIFLLPFAVAFTGLGVGAFVAMMVFLLLLVEGLVWAWQKGVLTWK